MDDNARFTSEGVAPPYPGYPHCNNPCPENPDVWCDLPRNHRPSLSHEAKVIFVDTQTVGAITWN